MEKRVIFVLSLFLILVFSLSFVSAGFFSDAVNFWKKITGQATYICGNGILEEGELCDYLATNIENNPFGDQCSTGCWVNGAPPYWQGCRGSGAHVCTDHPDVTDQYFIDNPLCIPNPTCNGRFFNCNGVICPEPREVPEEIPSAECGNGILEGSELCDYAATDEINNPYGDRCSTLCWVNKVGNWKGCLGSGVHVCAEKVIDQYFIDHPKCIEHTNCLGLYENCDDTFCPNPEIGPTNETTPSEPTNETVNVTEPVNVTGIVNETVFNETRQNETISETQTRDETSTMSPEIEESPLIEGCVDSEGGIDYGEKGVIDDGFGNIIEDSCSIEGVGSRLIEYYCEENADEIKFEYHNCELGCFEGECIQAEGILSKIADFFVRIFEGEPDPISLIDPDTGELVSGSPIEIEGDLIVDHLDDFENNRSETFYIILEDDGEGIILNFIGEPPELLTGSEIKVKGIESENRFLVESVFVDESESGSGIEVSFSASPIFIEEDEEIGGGTGSGRRIDKKIAVIMLNFKNDRSEPYSAEKLDNMIFSGKESLRSYYLENSYGRLGISGDVFGWYTIDRDNDGCDIDRNYVKWIEEAHELAKDSGVNFNDYDYEMYVFPSTPSCYWGGRGEIGGKTSWINGVLPLSIFTHEFGHNLGVHHASYLDCGLSQVSEQCNKIEYGDPFDVMGSSPGYFNAPHKNFLGLISQNKLQIITTSGTYTLNPLEASGSNTQVLWVYQRDIPTRGEISDINPGDRPKILSYFIEYRSPVGFNIKLPEVVTRGVLVTKGSQRTSLLDATPESTIYDQLDSALMDGMSFYDMDNGLTITQISHDKNSATVSVEFGEITCMRKSPSIDVSYDGEGGGNRKNYLISVINNDPPPCGGSREFTINVDTPLPLETIGSTDYSISLRSGETHIILLLISGTSGTHEFSVEVTDDSGQKKSDTASYIDAITLTADGTEYISINPFENINLEWAISNNPNQCKASVVGCWGRVCSDYIDTWSGSISSAGSKLEGPFSWPGETFLYAIKCSYDGGYDRASVTVVTTQLPPKITFFAEALLEGDTLVGDNIIEDDAVVEDGTRITLRWSATSNPTCAASRDWSGAKPARGSENMGIVSWPNTYIYTITCENDFGSDTKSLFIGVLEPSIDTGGSGGSGGGPLDEDDIELF